MLAFVFADNIFNKNLLLNSAASCLVNENPPAVIPTCLQTAVLNYLALICTKI